MSVPPSSGLLGGTHTYDFVLSDLLCSLNAAPPAVFNRSRSPSSPQRHLLAAACRFDSLQRFQPSVPHAARTPAQWADWHREARRDAKSPEPADPAASVRLRPPAPRPLARRLDEGVAVGAVDTPAPRGFTDSATGSVHHLRAPASFGRPGAANQCFLHRLPHRLPAHPARDPDPRGVGSLASRGPA